MCVCVCVCVCVPHNTQTHKHRSLSVSSTRWHTQARRLPGYAGCRLIYIIEGDASERRVHGGGVGRASLNVSLAQVEREIESLSAKGFECLRSTSLRDTCKRLAEVLRQVASDFGDGAAYSSACGSACGSASASSSAATSGTASLMSYQDFILKLNSSAVNLNANQDADANAHASVSRERVRARAQVSERERERERERDQTQTQVCGRPRLRRMKMR